MSVLLTKRIVVAAAGVSHSIFVDSDGVAYTCGTGKGFLGHGDGRIKTVPTKVAALEVCNPTDVGGHPSLKMTVVNAWVPLYMINSLIYRTIVHVRFDVMSCRHRVLKW